MRIDEKELNEQLAVNATETVAMVAVRAIGELSCMMDAAGTHDEASTSMVMGLCAWLTSVLDGKSANPAYAFVDAAKTLDDAMLDELSRCQHYVAEMHERTKKAESLALVSEDYARWYLRLRDNPDGPVFACNEEPIDRHAQIFGEELDALMEDLDIPSSAPPPPSEFK